MRPSRVLRRLRAGSPASCTKLNLTDARAAEIACQSGFDCIWLDNEHTSTDWKDLEHLIRAAKVLPALVASILALIAICGAIAAALAHFADVDALTAYLATSPGGADSVAIIAASTQVDAPFIMAMQIARFLVVLALGPAIARFVARRVGA